MSRAGSCHGAGLALGPWRQQGPAQDKRVFVSRRCCGWCAAARPTRSCFLSPFCACGLFPWNRVQGCESKCPMPGRHPRRLASVSLAEFGTSIRLSLLCITFKDSETCRCETKFIYVASQEKCKHEDSSLPIGLPSPALCILYPH